MRREMRSATLLASGLLAAACGTSPEDISPFGTWDLAEVEGEPLPATVGMEVYHFGQLGLGSQSPANCRLVFSVERSDSTHRWRLPCNREPIPHENQVRIIFTDDEENSRLLQIQDEKTMTGRLIMGLDMTWHRRDNPGWF